MSLLNVLVLGGAGYIGSHQVKLLSEYGYNPITYDNLSTGYKSLIIEGEFIKGDLNDEVRLTQIFEKYDIHAVMHFAGYINVSESVEKPGKYYYNNVNNVIKLLNLMIKNDIRYFIFSSSAAVYGAPKSIPIKENQNKSPINPYGRTKSIVEEILLDYNKAYDLKFTCFRYFNAAGADESGEIGEKHDPETHLIPLILDTVMGERDKFYIYGTDYNTRDGTCVRDFVHVNDLARAHILGLEDLFKYGNSDIYNLGSGTGYSVLEVVDMVKTIVGEEFKVVEGERREGDPPELIADISKARSNLDWKPEYGLKDIIKTAWKWHKNKG